jgi:hypothetical protein
MEQALAVSCLLLSYHFLGRCANIRPFSVTILGMVGLVMVDGEAWAWMGWPRAADGIAFLQGAEQTAFEYTSTKSIFTFDVAGKINLTATFLSPLTPHDLRRQSLTMSYLQVEVVSSDGKAHNVSVYADISAGEKILCIFFSVKV